MDELWGGRMGGEVRMGGYFPFFPSKSPSFPPLARESLSASVFSPTALSSCLPAPCLHHQASSGITISRSQAGSSVLPPLALRLNPLLSSLPLSPPPPAPARSPAHSRRRRRRFPPHPFLIPFIFRSSTFARTPVRYMYILLVLFRTPATSEPV